MRNLPQTVPSLSGTFSIHTRLALKPKMLKKPSSPSHTIVLTVKHCSKIETFELKEENSQHITKAIRNLGIVLILKFLALCKFSSKLKINRFKIPNYA